MGITAITPVYADKLPALTPGIFDNHPPIEIELEFELKELMPTPIDELMKRIRACESGGNDRIKNQITGIATGRYQFLPSTWEHYGKMYWGKTFTEKDILNGEDQEELTRWIITNYGTDDWLESKPCWDK